MSSSEERARSFSDEDTGGQGDLVSFMDLVRSGPPPAQAQAEDSAAPTVVLSAPSKQHRSIIMRKRSGGGSKGPRKSRPSSSSTTTGAGGESPPPRRALRHRSSSLIGPRGGRKGSKEGSDDSSGEEDQKPRARRNSLFNKLNLGSPSPEKKSASRRSSDVGGPVSSLSFSKSTDSYEPVKKRPYTLKKTHSSMEVLLVKQKSTGSLLKSNPRRRMVRAKSENQLFSQISSGSSDPILSLVSPRQPESPRPVLIPIDAALCQKRSFACLSVVLNAIISAEEDTEATPDMLFVAIVEMLKLNGNFIDYLSYRINYEIKGHTGENTLFRQRSIATMLCSAVFRGFSGRSYLAHVLAPVLWNLLSTTKPITQVLDGFFTFLSQSFETSLPVMLRRTLQQLFTIVSVRAPDFAMQTVSNFFFLRFVLPALSSPQIYCEVKVTDENRSRLVLASKLLQWVGNGTTPGENSSHADLIPWVEEHHKVSSDFFISLVRSRNTDNELIEQDCLEFENTDMELLRKKLFGWITKHESYLEDKWGNQRQTWENINKEVRELVL